VVGFTIGSKGKVPGKTCENIAETTIIVVVVEKIIIIIATTTTTLSVK
jgi:hypothetical protein